MQAGWLLRAPSLGSVPHSISAGLAAFFQTTAPNCHPNTLQQVSSSPPTCQCLPLFLSFYQTHASRYCSVIYLCWSLTLVLWQCTLSDSVSPVTSSFFSLASLPLTLPLAASLSFAEFMTSESTQKQLLVHTYVAFDIIWISQISGSTAWWGLKCWRPFLRERLHHLHLFWM